MPIMACNIFKTQITRDSNGNLETVRDHRGRKSKLYENILKHLRNNREEPSVYDGEYISSLIDEGFINADSIVDAPLEEIALAYYSKIYSPSFKNYYGDWENSGNQNEPTFEKASSIIFSRAVENQIDYSGLEYDPGVINEVLNPLMEDIIAEGLSVGEVLEIMAENGLTAPEAVIERAMQLKRSSNGKKGKQLKSDIYSEKYDTDTLKALYKEYGYSSSDIDGLLDAYKNPKQDSQTGTLKDTDDLHSLDEDAQVNAFVKAVRASVPSMVLDLYDKTKDYIENDPRGRRRSGFKVRGRKSLRIAYRNLKNKGLIRDSQEGTGQSAQLKVLLLALNEMMPTLTKSGIQVTLHDTSASYLNQLEANGLQDVQHFNTSGFVVGNQVHIHAANPLVDGSVAAHEVLHPIVEQIFQNNRELYDQMKADVESDSTITDTYLDLNEEGTADPSMEEIINYLAKGITESIVKRHTDLPENFKIEQVRSEDLADSLFIRDKDYSARNLSEMWLLFRKVLNKVKKVLGLSGRSESSYFDEVMNNKETGTFLLDLTDHMLNGRPMRVNTINNTNVRFSSATNLEDAIINIIATHENVFIDQNGNPTSTLMKVAKELDLSPSKLEDIVKNMYKVERDAGRAESDKDFITKDTFMKRIEGGMLGDGRKARVMKAYLSGKMRDVMPDSMMAQIYATYLRTRYGDKPRKHRPTHTDLAKDLLASNLPVEVKYYMLSHFLARFESQIENDTSVEIAEKLASLRTSWGRMGRYLQDDQNTLFGPVEALVRNRNKRSRSKRVKDTRDNILSALSLTKEEVQGMLNKFNDIQIKSFFTKLRLLGTEGSDMDTITAEEVRSTVMSTGMKILTEMGVDVSDIIARGGVQKSKGDSSQGSVPNLDNLSQAKINKIIDAYIRIARGNTAQAQFMFEQTFGEKVRKKHWALNDTLNQNAVQYSKSHAVQTVKIGLQDIIDGKPATRKSPVMYTLREALQLNGYLTNDRGKPVPIDKAAKKLLNEMELGTVNMTTLIENAAMGMSNMLLREDTRKDVRKKSQLKRARTKAYALLGKMSMNESDYQDADQTLEAISGIVAREIRDTLTDYFSNPNASVNRSTLAMRLTYQMGLPEGVALAVEKEVEDYIAATVKTEQRRDTVKKYIKYMQGADVEKIMQLAAEGILDDQTLAATFPKAFSQADAPLPIALVAQLRKLRDDFVRANTRYEKNKVFERAKSLVNKEFAGSGQIVDSIMNEIFYGNVLSGYSTMYNVAYGTLSYAMVTRLTQATSDVAYILRKMVTDPKMSKRRLGTIKRSLTFQFYEMFKSDNRKATVDKIKELYLGDLGDLKSLESERDPAQHAGYNIYDDFVTNEFRDRAKAVKRMFKGTPDDIMQGAKLLIQSIYSDDLGSEFANRKVANIHGRRAIRLGSALLPILAGGLGLAVGGGIATIGATVAITAVSPLIFSRSILVLDYFFKNNIERQSLVRNAEAMLNQEEGVDYTNEEFFERMDELLGRDPESLRDMEKVIDNDMMYEIEKFEDEYFEKNNSRPTTQEVDKFATKYRRRRKMEMITEFADEFLQDAAKRQANNQTLTGLPAGAVGKRISQLNRLLAVRSKEDSSAFENFGKGLLSITLKLSLIPFANVMGHMVNIVYDSTVGSVQAGGRKVFGLNPTHGDHVIRQWNPQENRYEYIEMSYNEIQHRMFRRLLAVTGAGLVIMPQVVNWLRGEDDDDRDDEDIMGPEVDPTHYKSGFEIFGKRYRVTGTGNGLTFGEQQRMGDYSPLTLQVLNEDTGQYENALDLANNIIPGILLAPLGIKTDKEIMQQRSIADKDMEKDLSASFTDIASLYLGLSIGQSFNQSTDVAYKAIQLFFPGANAEDYEKTRARNELIDQFTKPYQALIKSNLSTQTYKLLSKLQGDKINTFSDETNRENWAAFVWSRFTKGHPTFDPMLENELTDALGYPIYQKYEASEETRTLLTSLFGDRFDKVRAKSPLYTVLDKDTRMSRPSGGGMLPESKNPKKGYEYDLPSVITNTVYTVSKSYRNSLMENPEFVELMSDLMKQDVTSRTLNIAKDYLDPKSLPNLDDFKSRMNNRLNGENYLVAKQVMDSAGGRAQNEAKTEVFRDLFSKYLSADAREFDTWDDVIDYMSKNNMRIYQEGGDLVFAKPKGGSSKDDDRTRVPMSELEADMRALAQMSNARIPDLDDSE